MNRDELKGKWTQLRGSVKEKWGQLTDNELNEIQGNMDKLIGRIQELYGKTKQEAEREIDEWLSQQEEKDNKE